jgi:hypothetical protein
MQAKLVKQVKPSYPEDARQYSFEGFVREFFVRALARHLCTEI